MTACKDCKHCVLVFGVNNPEDWRCEKMGIVEERFDSLHGKYVSEVKESTMPSIDLVNKGFGGCGMFQKSTWKDKYGWILQEKAVLAFAIGILLISLIAIYAGVFIL